MFNTIDKVFLILVFGFLMYQMIGMVGTKDRIIEEYKVKLATTQGYEPSIINWTQVDISDLNDAEKILAKKIMGEVGLLYTTYTKSITFTKNISTICTHCLGAESDQNIWVQWTNNEDDMKQTLCHELIHTITYTTTNNSNYYKDPLHGIVDNLANQKVCYDHSDDYYVAWRNKIQNRRS